MSNVSANDNIPQMFKCHLAGFGKLYRMRFDGKKNASAEPSRIANTRVSEP